MPPLNELEQAVAQALAYERNRDKPNAQDEQDAIKFCSKWNLIRIKMGFKAWV